MRPRQSSSPPRAPNHTIVTLLQYHAEGEGRSRDDGDRRDGSRDAPLLPSASIEEIARRQQQLPCEILPHLFLSDAKGARDIGRLQELGITRVLNAAGPAARGPADDYTAAGITVKEFDAEDESGYPMLKTHLQASREFVEDARRKGGKVVIHCVAGINRSGVLVAAELMLFKRIPVLEAVAHCRRQRGNAFLWNKT